MESNPDKIESQDEVAEATAKITRSFQQQLNLDVQEEFQFGQVENGNRDEEEREEDDDGESDDDFTFVLAEDEVSPIAADKVFQDGQIRPIYPLFDQHLLFADDDSENHRLPTRPPVNKVFIESPHRPSSLSTSESEQTDGVAAGPFCDWSKEAAAPEVCKKSNSTGFSKLWRFKEIMNRSNSDGRDAFVFFNHSTTSSTAKREEKSVLKAEAKSSDKKTARDGSSEIKTAGAGGKLKTKKGKVKVPISAHEAYLKSRGQSEDDRRRSYLPYRPELMGFFTNVNGGLSRNVHPF